MTKVYTMYNNKGGVSKTTTLFNLAVYLSQQQKKVLIVDCDPQCNMTEIFFASNSDFDQPEVELPGTSIFQALLPRFKGEAGTIHPDTVELAPSPIYGNLFLFRGDLEFSLAETYFGTAWNQAITENIHEKNTYVSLHRLFQAIGSRHNFDYILCDVGPSTGAITRMVVLACDGVFLPLVPDRFCNQAVRLLGKIVHDWVARHEQISESLAPFSIKSFPGKPVFLGGILQNYKVQNNAKAKESYVKWQTKISENIKEHLVSADGMIPAPTLDVDNPYLASIRDMSPLAPVAQMFGRAIFDIEQEHTREASTTGRMYYGTVWDPWVDRMTQYKEEISKVAGAIL
ncbi:ParA family protein [Paenibacillus sp.]|uniref:ParA family protein n=1 Tax=Paenibacillus sp. TaxID=58172 RepID=UPI00356467AF